MKDLKISKELIEEVMKDKGTFETININKNELSTFGVFGHHIFSINIYEFTFKCKEWAKNNEYIVHSSPTQKREHTAIVQSFDINKFYYGKNQFYALTEVEAIIKACEWILSEVNR